MEPKLIEPELRATLIVCLESIRWWRMTRRYIFILEQTLNARTVSQLDFWTDQMGALKRP